MSWAKRELATMKSGDRRVDERAKIVLERLGDRPGVSIPAACNGWGETQGAYRLFDNDKVTMEKVLQPHIDAAIERMHGHEVVLCVQDTTDLNYSGQKGTEGLGPMTYSAERGMYLHPTLAVTPDRIALGLVDTWTFVRDEGTHGKVKGNHRPIQEKESVRWLDGYYSVSVLQGRVPGTQLVYVADREGDIYEVFAAAHSLPFAGADYLIRAAQDRKLVGAEGRKLWGEAEKAPILGRIEFVKPKTKDQPARRVVQTLRAARVVLHPPYRKGEKLEEVEVTVILAREENPPEGMEVVEWLLVTNMQVETLDEAAEKLKWYLCRWQIEIYFRILKSGCTVEKLQLKKDERLEPALAIYMIIAWRILFLTMLGRKCPELPCDVAFDQAEWKAAYLISKKEQPPEDPPPLNEMIKMIAGFGGFLGRKGDGDPGPKALWIGLQRVHDFMITLETQGKVEKEMQRRVGKKDSG